MSEQAQEIFIIANFYWFCEQRFIIKNQLPFPF